MARIRTAIIGNNEAIVTTPKPERDESPLPAEAAIPIPNDNAVTITVNTFHFRDKRTIEPTTHIVARTTGVSTTNAGTGLRVSRRRTRNEEGEGAWEVSVIGFCFGGYATYVAACTVDGISAAMPFYGGGIAARVGDMQPKCPTQFHFGDKDAAIPLDDLQKIKDALQDSPLYVYDDSGHGFTCDDRDSFNAGATERAFTRAVAWMDKHAA